MALHDRIPRFAAENSACSCRTLGGFPRGAFGSRKKKLIGAARKWAGVAPDDGGIDDGVASALAAFGARQVDVDSARERARESDFEVYPDNWETVQVFLALGTQWRAIAVSTMASARVLQTGIDYGAIDPVFRLLGVARKRRAAVFEKLRVMEEAALDVMHSS
ncbi:DUF1799 domain-containing protein [Paraburkholderia sp. EG287B]|uniref:DUF1799 domain-containing protein n=1 Tax=Paraburkholderia sp. EG287B TaxID=3237010 RepID=UPI0034D33585